MEKIEELFKENGDKAIAAFAFNTGRLIEDVIKIRTNDLEKVNHELSAKILRFREKLSKMNNTLSDLLLKEYDEHFGIVKD